MGRQEKKKIAIALLEAQPVIRTGIEVCLAGDPRLSIVGSGARLEDVVQLLGDRAPDVFVIDDASITNSIRRICRIYPSSKVVAFSTTGSPMVLQEALREGVHGYMLQSSSIAGLIHAIVTVHAGGVYVGPRASRLLSSESSWAYGLTKREREVLKMIAAGHTSREIASLLRVSVRTVESHRKHISQKLGIRSVAQLTRFAISRGITES